MQSVEMRGMNQLSDDLEALLKESPKLRRELHQELADMAQKEVRQAIAGSVNDSHGRVRGWQEKYVGSGGGYAAVRPTDSSTGKNSPGAITNYLEGGHKIRPASGTAKRKRKPRIRVAYVDGRHFYASAATRVEAKALQIAEAFADSLAEKLGG